MHRLRHILDTTCQLMGFEKADRSVVYLFHFSAEPFQGYQISLEKREARDGCYYRIKQSNIGAFKATGLFPAIVNTNYFHSWPQGNLLQARKVDDPGESFG